MKLISLLIFLIIFSTIYSVEGYQTLITSPLQQFKSGIVAKDVKCGNNFQLIIKAEDGSPACVKPDDATRLLDRGWAKEIIYQKSDNATVHPSSMLCDTPFPQSNAGVTVMYMPMNSIGKICVRYSNLNGNPASVGIRIFEAKNIGQDATEITTGATANTIPAGNSTIVYTIKTGNQAGFYGLSIFCGGMPFAVGYNNDSRIVSGDFPWLGGTIYCPSQSYEFHIDSLSGIGVKYIPFP